MFSLEVLTWNEFDVISSVKPIADTVSKLLEILQSKNDLRVFDNFLEALKKTEQQHVVNYLKGVHGKNIYNVDLGLPVYNLFCMFIITY